GYGPEEQFRSAAMAFVGLKSVIDETTRNPWVARRLNTHHSPAEKSAENPQFEILATMSRNQ
ncbi:hypothetical protein BZG17_29055, partial [Escherichia coli]|nr:hypothetical protein [Escherichia coli]